MRNLQLICALLLIISMTSCSRSPFENEKKQEKLAGEFKSKTYRINDFEHVTVFDMPDNFLGSRCWVFVNEKTNTSHMKCDDSYVKDLPEDNNGQLDK